MMPVPTSKPPFQLLLGLLFFAALIILCHLLSPVFQLFCNAGLHKFRATGRPCSHICRKFVQTCCHLSSLPEYYNFFIYLIDPNFSRISEFVFFLFVFVSEVGSKCMYRCLIWFESLLAHRLS